MDTFECIRKRRDIRSYLKKDVPDDVIRKIVEAGGLAPSAMNLQPWHFIVIKNRDKLKKLGKFFISGGVFVVVITEPSNKWHEIDGTRAVQNMSLAAWNEGVGTCWIGAIDREKVKEKLH